MVRLVYQNEITIPSTIKKSQKEGLEQIKNIIPIESKGFYIPTELAAENKDKAHFQVAIINWDLARISYRLIV
jgi:hypothetical protein